MAELEHGALPALASAGAVKKKRVLRSSLMERYGSFALALFVLVVWQAAVPLLGLSEFVLPTPWAIGKRMVTDAGLLTAHASYTLLEVMAGFGAAVLVGIPLALAIFYSRVFERAVYPMLVALQTEPIRPDASGAR